LPEGPSRSQYCHQKDCDHHARKLLYRREPGRYPKSWTRIAMSASRRSFARSWTS
jgi:hypothetical protein